MKLFDIVLADPPWHYNSRRASGSRSRFGGGASAHYSLMPDAELLALPVKEITAKNAVLFLWATWPRMPIAMELIKAWGFEYKTCAFDWFKVSKNGSLLHGVGYYSKSNSEPCLLATKGKPLKPDSAAISMALEDFEQEAFKSVRGVHSRKPIEVHRRIEKLYPHARKLEMFARQPREGWVTWGNELTNQHLTEMVSVPATAKQKTIQAGLFGAQEL